MKISKKEFLEKFGDVEVKFSHYYKFEFTYSADLGERIRLVVAIGGSAEDIYREEVGNNEVRTVSQLDPFYGIYFVNGEERIRFYED